MESVLRALILITTLCQTSFAALQSDDSDSDVDHNCPPEILKFQKDYRTLRGIFSKQLFTSPNKNPLDTNVLSAVLQSASDGPPVKYCANKDYVKSYLNGSVNIKHILWLAKLLKMYESHTVIPLPGFTQQNVDFLNAVIDEHKIQWKKIKLPLFYPQSHPIADHVALLDELSLDTLGLPIQEDETEITKHD